MLSAIGIVPSAPVLVPELAGAAAAELADLGAAVIAAASLLPKSWIAVGTGRADFIDKTSTTVVTHAATIDELREALGV